MATYVYASSQGKPSLADSELGTAQHQLVSHIVSTDVGFGPSVLRAPAEQTKVATVLGNWSERRCADCV